MISIRSSLAVGVALTLAGLVGACSADRPENDGSTARSLPDPVPLPSGSSDPSASATLPGGTSVTGRRSPTPRAPARPSTAALTEGTLVDIGERRLFLACRGTGSPTVVFEAGAGSVSSSWRGIWPSVARLTRACIYDRAGRGRSDDGPAGRTGLQTARDLRRLLETAGVEGPYVLVAHSLGGVYARLFADEYRAETAGIVFVDSLPADPGRLLAALPLELQGWVRNELENGEGIDLDRTARELRGVGSLGGLPLVVLSAGRRSLPSWFDRETASAVAEAWRDGHRALAALSDRGRLVVATRSGHDIQDDEPELVIEAIREVLAASGG